MYIVSAKSKNSLWPSNKLKVAPSQKRLGATGLCCQPSSFVQTL